MNKKSADALCQQGRDRGHEDAKKKEPLSGYMMNTQRSEFRTGYIAGYARACAGGDPHLAAIEIGKLGALYFMPKKELIELLPNVDQTTNLSLKKSFEEAYDNKRAKIDEEYRDEDDDRVLVYEKPMDDSSDY